MAVNYDAGRGARGAYANLRAALADQSNAENARRARDIERKGLFGTGIRASDLQGMAQMGLAVGEFGQARRDKQMDRATKSYERRRGETSERLGRLDKQADLGNKEARKEASFLRMDMGKERDRYEDMLDKYSGSGLMGSSFGSKSVGYRGAEKGERRSAQRYQDYLKQKEGPGETAKESLGETPSLEVQDLVRKPKPQMMEETIDTSGFMPEKPRAPHDLSAQLQVQDLTPSPKGSMEIEEETLPAWKPTPMGAPPSPITDPQGHMDWKKKRKAREQKNMQSHVDNLSTGWASDEYDNAEIDEINKYSFGSNDMGGYR